MSGADEESCAETSSNKSFTSSRKVSKARKPERKRPIPFAPRVHPTSTPSAIASDPGYVSSGSQGYASTGYNSSGYETEYLHGGGEEEITPILYQQSLSDPLEVDRGATTYPPSYPSLTNPSSHVTNHVTPNGKASRQNGGGLMMPAGRSMNPASMTVPQQLLHQQHQHTNSWSSPAISPHSCCLHSHPPNPASFARPDCQTTTNTCLPAHFHQWINHTCINSCPHRQLRVSQPPTSHLP